MAEKTRKARTGSKATAESLDGAPPAPEGAEFERYLQTLKPVLQGAALKSLTDERIDSLARETAIDREHLGLMVRAARMADKARRGSSAAKAGTGTRRAAPTDVFYGLLRQNALELPATRSTEDLEAAANRSIDAGIIARAGRSPASVRADVKSARNVALLEPAPGGSASLGDLLGTIPRTERPTQQEQLRFAELHAAHGTGDDLWKAVGRSELRSKLAVFKRTAALEDLTGAHVPMMKALQAEHGSRNAESTAYLVAVSPRKWRDLVDEQGAPEGVPPRVYAERLQTAVERAHPAAALRERLKSNDVRIRDFPKKEVTSFLTRHTDFDFRTHTVDSYLDDKRIKSEELRRALKQVNRALPLAGGRIDAAAAIVDAGFKNGHEIAMAGPEKVKALLSDTLAEDHINRIVKNATERTLEVVGLGSMKFGLPPVVGLDVTPPPEPAVPQAEGPTLQSLFGSMDFCECRHCRSVLGPAAYFADLLHFLETLPISDHAGKTALDGILARRGDLQHLELSCENTSTEIPYVDLVLEVLENAAALPLPIVLLQALRPPGAGITVVGAPPPPAPTAVAAQFQEGQGLTLDQLPEKVRLALKMTAITIGDRFDVKRTTNNAQTRESIWAVSDGSRRWELQHRVEHLRAWEDFPSGAQVRDLPELTGFAAIKTEFQRGYPHTKLIEALAPEALFPVKAVTNIVPAPVPSGVLGGRTQVVREIALEFPSTHFSLGGQIKAFDHSGALLAESSVLDYLSLHFASEWLRQKTTNSQASIVLARAAMDDIGLPIALIDRASVRSQGGRYILSLSQAFLLELVPDDMSVVALAYQDSSILTHLAAVPENRNPQAYMRLGSTEFPWTLPFDLALEETRVYLADLGVPRRGLIEMLTQDGAENDASAAEILGLSAREWDLIAPPAGTTPSLAAQWGVDPANNWLYDERLGSHRTGAMRTVLRWVSVVMQQSRLSYRELLEVLQTVPASVRTRIEPESGCEPTMLQLRGGSLDSTLFWIHRFVRLWRRTGWTIRGLDRALAVFTRRIENKATLHGLAKIQLLCEQLETSPLVVAGMLGALETETWTPYEPEGAIAEPSLYHKLFQQNALRASDSFPLFKLKPDGALSAAGTDTLGGHAEFIAAALGIATADVNALSSGTGRVVTADTLTFDNVELLYGVTAFARRLHVSITDFLRWQRLLTPNAPPFNTTGAARADALLAFRNDVVFARASGQDLDALEYLLLDERVGSFANADQEVEDGIQDIHSALLAGDVLAKVTNENLRLQLQRAGAPRELATALESIASIAQYLWAEITFAWTNANPPQAVPTELADVFRWTYDADTRQLRFSCRGFVETAAFNQVPLPAQARTQLRRRYELIRDVVASQIERAAPRDVSGAPASGQWPSFTFPVPAPQFAPGSPAIPRDFASFLAYDAASGRLALTGFITQVQGTALKAALDPRLAAGIDNLVAQSAQARSAWIERTLALDLLRDAQDPEIIARVLRRTAPFLEGSLLAERVAAYAGIDQRLCDALLDRIRVGTPPRTARAALFSEAFLASASPVSAAAGAAQREVLARIKKAALLLEGTPLNAAQTAWLFGGAFSVIDVNSLPVGTAAPRASFADWRAWRELLVLAQSMKDGFTAVEQLGGALASGAPQPNDLLREACELTDAQHVADAAGVLSMTWPGHFRRPQRVLKLATLLNLMRMLGCTADRLRRLAVFSPSDADAMSARSLFMAQFDSTTLPVRMEPVSNKLRVRQRDALIDYLRTRKQLRSPDALLDYYLIDVEMGTCMRTSRLKQAISSVQLYVQRCLLGLERVNTVWPVAPHHINTRRWNWMKNYRVWEANRKVFLFPENWIEPELRDDKTEIFRALESELLQADLTHDRALRAFSKYLEGAAGLAKLKVLDLEEERVGNDYIVHFVAVDQGKPRNIYYRSLRLKQSIDYRAALHWTPWESIDGDIASDHAVIFKVGPFLQIGYPVVSSDDDGSTYKVGLAVRRKTLDGWTSAKQSTDSLPMAAHPNKSPFATMVLGKEPPDSPTDSTVHVHLYAPRRLQSLISRSVDAPYEKTSEGLRLRQLTLHIRVLERFVDSFGHAFLRETQRPLALDFVLEYRTDDGGFRVAQTTPYRVSGRFDFSGDVSNLAPPTSDLRSFASWCNAIRITAFGDPARHTVEKKFMSAEADLGASGVWITDIVFNVKPEIRVEDEFPPERSLESQLAHVGSFSTTKDFAILVSTLPPPGPPIQPIRLAYLDTEHCGPGYLRRADVADGSPFRVQGQEVLAETHGRYFYVHAYQNSDSIVAYRDDRYALTAIRINIDINQWNVKYRILSLGQDWILDNGIEALVALPQGEIDLQNLPALPNTVPPFLSLAPGAWQPSSTVYLTPVFDPSFPASIYDWETFFHVPLLIAVQLSQAQRFEEARRWFHTIFDPTSNRTVDSTLPLAQQEAVRHWSFPPFRAAAIDELEVDDLLEAYAKGTLSQAKRDELETNIEAWKDKPFSPHLIARFRKRGYMWAVVIKYVQNLIAWGDQLFRRETIEFINEATQLYILAARILGPRPQSAPRKETRPRTYAELATLEMDRLSNVWSEWEDRQPFDAPPENILETIEDLPATVALASVGSLYFCIPHNAGLTTLWDTLEERLFNIRHCRNIDGIERKLPLFEPPIDPALLVRAAAAGLPIGDVLAGFGAPLPLHRFSVMLPKATELCADVRALGAAVLTAFEKKDAEQLSLLRNTHEIALLKLTEQLRQRQIDEAKVTVEGLEESRRTAEERYKHYQRLLDRKDAPPPQKDEPVTLAPILTGAAKSGLEGKEQGLGISQTELDQLRRLAEAQELTLAAGISSTIAGVLFAVGGILSAFKGQTPAGQVDPGSALSGAGHALNAVSSALGAAAGYQSATAGRDAIIGGHERRRDEWIFNSNMALRELAQIDKQSAAAQIRTEIAEKELANTRAQIENAKSVDDFLTSKYSSAQLYRYMSGQLLSLYFRTYQLAIEVAKSAERCFQFELGQPGASFIKPAYWDSAKKGLLSGEQLSLDLRRMDLAYLESHKREYEITKHVSLTQIDPLALIALRQNGRCEFAIPEVLYDLDCPGHYMRRIKSVSITIPCITGPYAGVHCTLTLLSSSVRKDGRGQKYEKSVDDPRFADDFSSIQSIVSSSAQADTGLFETSLREERYLPFEGAGAISTWRLELPSEMRQFDYDTISDVILHVRYTAREGGGQLRQLATSHALAVIARIAPVRLFSVRHEFPTEWAKFKSGQDLSLDIKPEHYPFWTRGTGATTARGPSLVKSARSVSLLATSSGAAQAPQIRVTTKGTTNVTWEARLARQQSMAGLLLGTLKPPAAGPASELKPIGAWSLHFDNGAIDDLWMVVDWSVPESP